MPESVMFDIKASAVLKVIAIIVGVVFLYLLRDVLMILFFAIMIASAVGPFADWMESKRIPRILGVLLLYIIVAILMTVLLAILVPVATFELRQLTQALPQFFSNLSSVLENAQNSSYYFDFFSNIQGLLDDLTEFLQFSSSSVFSLVIKIFGGFISFVAIIVISFYFSIMRQGIPTFLRSVLPDQYEGYVIGLWKRAEIKVGRWFQGQLLLALSLGLFVFVGLSLLNVKYALLLGIIAMLLEVVPIAGPVLAAIPAIILAFFQSTGLGFVVIIFYLLAQQAENHFLAPVILGKSTGLNPVTVIISLLIGAKLAGVLGALIAVPVAVVIVEVLDDMAEKRQATLRGE